MSDNTQAILEFTIKVTAKASEETKQLIRDLEQAKQTSSQKSEESDDNVKIFGRAGSGRVIDPTTGRDATDDVQIFGRAGSGKQNKFAEEEQKKKEEEKLKKEVVDTLNKIDSKGLKTIESLATNPTGTIFSALNRIVMAAGPEAQAVVAAMTIIISSPTILKEVIKALSVKGGPLNRDWQRLVGKEVDAGLGRELVKKRELGFDQVILNQQKGYVPNNANWTYNSFIKINSSRLARIGLSDRSAGVVVP